MTTYNLTVDVHDLEPTGPVPPSAEVRIWRAQPDASGPQVVSVKQKTYPVGTGPVVVSLTAGVAYWAEFTGVRGWETPFLFSGTVDTSIAERFRSGQLDPATLQPAATAPSIAATLAALQAQIDALPTGAGAGGGGGIALDTDGVPYYSASGSHSLALDTDGVPYYV